MTWFQLPDGSGSLSIPPFKQKQEAKLELTILNLHSILVKDLFPNYEINRTLSSLLYDFNLNLTVITELDPSDRTEVLLNLIYAIQLIMSELKYL